MRLADKIGRAVGGADGKNSRSGIKKTNGVVKFKLFYSKVGQKCHKARCWIIGFLIKSILMV